MIDKDQLKIRGLAFGRSLQTALKTAMMYSTDHPALEKTLEQTFASLNDLVRQTQQLTFGFMNQRVLIHNILTEENSLSQLEAEFSKRGIAAITFVVGITLQDFKRAMVLLATKPQMIEEKGGINPFLKQNPIEGVRVLPAKKSKGEDTVLGTDSESYLMAEEILGPEVRAALGSLDLFCQFAGMEKPEGSGGSPGEILDLVGKATETALMNPETDPRKLMTSLARMLEEVTPAYLLSALPQGTQKALCDLPVQEVAAELIEDFAVESAVKQLSNPPTESTMLGREEEVARFLFRGLRATRVAERLLGKLGRLLEESDVPPEVLERIRQRLAWYLLSQKEKYDQLMRLERFGLQEFQRLVALVKEMLSEGKINEAIQLAERYFAFLDSAPAELQTEGLAWAPELLRAMAGLHTLQFTGTIAERLCKELLNDTARLPERHQQLVNCLVSMAQDAAPYEEFELIHGIGSSLERSLAKDSVQHADCCGTALGHLLTPATAKRLMELYMQKRDNTVTVKTVTSLLKWLGSMGGETVLQRLEEETAPPRRMALMRLLGQWGSSGLEPARKRLTDERWYVVRNACRILADLRDPELPVQLRGALRHSDPRVQEEAVTSITKCQAADRAKVLADSLAYLHQYLLEQVLDELTVLRDPTSVAGLAQLFFLPKESKSGTLEKVVRVLASIPSEPAAEVLGKVLSDARQAMPVRRAALEALSRSSLAISQQLLAEFARLAPSDPLATEWQKSSTRESS